MERWNQLSKQEIIKCYLHKGTWSKQVVGEGGKGSCFAWQYVSTSTICTETAFMTFVIYDLSGFSPSWNIWFSLRKYPVQSGKIPVVLAIWHTHRQWSVIMVHGCVSAVFWVGLRVADLQLRNAVPDAKFHSRSKCCQSGKSDLKGDGGIRVSSCCICILIYLGRARFLSLHEPRD